MSNLYFYKDGCKYYVMSDNDVDIIKNKYKFKWVDILGSLCGFMFHEISLVTDETKNNSIIDVGNFEQELKFYVIFFSIENKKYFSVSCNKEIMKKKKMPFNKWAVELSCGHKFIMDNNLNDINAKRLFCPNCLEE